MDLFDRTEQSRTGAGEKAILVHLDLPDAMGREDLDEFHHLVTSSGVEPVMELTGKRDRPDPALFIGTGKSDELAQLVKEHGADVVLFNHALSPAQERNLERAVKCRVLDRTGLILDIFAQRARTHEGVLQVELAQLRHLSTRLVRGWTHLERQKGGIGLRGPGETQLETDRRLLRDRIRAIESKLEKVRKQRAQGRRARQRSETPLISLVGYTNAGKSTLFNAITTGDVYVADGFGKVVDGTLIGDNLGNAIFAKSGNGVVFDGGSRDLEGLSKIEGFNAFVRGFDPSYLTESMLMGINVPIRIGRATVFPGDVVLAKKSGVLFIPAHLAQKQGRLTIPAIPVGQYARPPTVGQVFCNSYMCDVFNAL